jgi:hypothetical protein
VDELIGQPGAILFESVAEYQAFGARVGPLLGAGKDAHLEWDFTARRQQVRQGVRPAHGQLPYGHGVDARTVRTARHQQAPYARQVAETQPGKAFGQYEPARTPMNAIVACRLALQPH